MVTRASLAADKVIFCLRKGGTRYHGRGVATADGSSWGETGNLQSPQVRVLFGRDLTFLLHTKCVKQSNGSNSV